MIRINLLPVRQTRKLEALRREVALAGILGAAIIGGCLFVWAGLGIRLSAVSADNVRIEGEIAKLAEDVKKVDEMEQVKAELEKKLGVIANLRARKSGPAHVLEELALAAPEKLQLSHMAEEDGTVTIEGVAVSNEIISQFLRALEASEYFEQVYLQNIEAADAGKQGGAGSSVVVKQFSLTAKLANPEVEKIEAAGRERKRPKPAAPPAGAETPPAGAGAPPAGADPAAAAPAGGAP